MRPQPARDFRERQEPPREQHGLGGPRESHLRCLRITDAMLAAAQPGADREILASALRDVIREEIFDGRVATSPLREIGTLPMEGMRAYAGSPGTLVQVLRQWLATADPGRIAFDLYAGAGALVGRPKRLRGADHPDPASPAATGGGAAG